MDIILYLIDIDNLDNCAHTFKIYIYIIIYNKSSDFYWDFTVPRFGVSNHLIVW